MISFSYLIVKVFVSDKFLRWSLVAASTFILDLVFFFILYLILTNIIIANILAFCLSSCFNFLLHKHFTFPSNNKSRLRALTYIVAITTSLFLNTILVYFLDVYMAEISAKTLSNLFMIPFNFLLMSRVVFVSKNVHII